MKRWTQYPLRSATKWNERHKCALHSVLGTCDGVIVFGETYRDAGKGARAHERCVRAAAVEAHDDTLALMGGAIAAGLFGLRVDRTKGAVN